MKIPTRRGRRDSAAGLPHAETASNAGNSGRSPSKRSSTSSPRARTNRLVGPGGAGATLQGRSGSGSRRKGNRKPPGRRTLRERTSGAPGSRWAGFPGYCGRHMAQDLEQAAHGGLRCHPEAADERRALDSLVDSQLSEYLDPAALGPTEPLESLERHFTLGEVSDHPDPAPRLPRRSLRAGAPARGPRPLAALHRPHDLGAAGVRRPARPADHRAQPERGEGRDLARAHLRRAAGAGDAPPARLRRGRRVLPGARAAPGQHPRDGRLRRHARRTSPRSGARATRRSGRSRASRASRPRAWPEPSRRTATGGRRSSARR